MTRYGFTDFNDKCEPIAITKTIIGLWVELKIWDKYTKGDHNLQIFKANGAFTIALELPKVVSPRELKKMLG